MKTVHKLSLYIMTLLVCHSAFAVTKSRFEELELFNKVLYLIENQYYREVDTSKLIEGALKGMMDTLDPHSAFLNKEFFKKMQNETDGEFGGLGIEVTQKDGIIYVVTPIDDTPAFKAGILPRDKIVEINGDPLLGLTLDQAIDKMKGKQGSQIKLGILREGEKDVKTFTLTREIIKIKPVKFELLDEEFAYVRLTQFQRRAADSIESSLKSIQKKLNNSKKLKGIILDLRSNPGGLLDQAVDVSSLFLKEGVVVSTEARDPSNKDIRYVKKTGFKDLETPLVVLVNGASASASEIVAGALQDHKRALVMGSQTFGKGSVQTVAKIDPSGEYGLKLTIAQYMTPKNRKIQAIGITPDVILQEYDLDQLNEAELGDRFLREKDLRNHLTATIETEDEKKLRMKKESIDRKERISSLKKNKVKNAKDDIFNKYQPSQDYQVLQAINHLKTFRVLKDFGDKL